MHNMKNGHRLFIIIAFVFALFIKTNAQPGYLNTQFNPTDLGYGRGEGRAGTAYAKQPDGKILVGTGFRVEYNKFEKSGIFRINADGTLDRTFDAGWGFASSNNTNGRIFAIAVQNDGKILVAGEFWTFGGQPRKNLARLNPDGSLDVSFTVGSGTTASFPESGAITDVDLQSDGKIIISGYFSHYNGTPRPGVARLHLNGTLDATFNPSNVFGPNVEILPSGKILMSDSYTLTRRNSDGTVDPTFTFGSTTQAIYWDIGQFESQSNGKIIVIGSIHVYATNTTYQLARLNEDGTLDNTFPLKYPTSANILIQAEYGDKHGFIIQQDGKILVKEKNSSISPLRQLKRLNADGLDDPTFNLQSGIMFMGGAMQLINDKFLLSSNNKLIRIHNNGDYDSSFNKPFGISEPFPLTATSLAGVFATAIQTDGKIIAAGRFTNYQGKNTNNIIRISADGSMDNSFDSKFEATLTQGIVYDVALQNDGKIIVAGDFDSYDGINRIDIARLNPNGTLDASFDPGAGTGTGAIKSVVVQPDGKILIGGSFTSYNGTTRNCIARLNSDGSIDATFNPGTGFGGGTRVYSMQLQSDGKIIAVGGFTSFNGFARNGIVRINTTGSIDGTFNIGTGFNNPPPYSMPMAFKVRLQADGKIIVGGNFSSYRGSAANGLVRLNPDGTIDGTFSFPKTNAQILNLSLQTDGKIVYMGHEGAASLEMQHHYLGFLGRILANGDYDQTFAEGNLNLIQQELTSLSISTSNDIYIGGVFTAYNDTGRNRLAKVYGASVPLPVRYAYLNATCEEDATIISWATTSEQNSQRFDIEKNNGDGWNVIGSLPAAGFSGISVPYKYKDNDKGNGVYRLKQIDQDGRFTYSTIISSKCNDNIDQLSVYPNPAKDIIKVILTSPLKGKAELRIMDQTGRIVQQNTKPLVQGTNTLSLDVTNISKGVYVMQIQYENQIRSTLFTIQ